MAEVKYKVRKFLILFYCASLFFGTIFAHEFIHWIYHYKLSNKEICFTFDTTFGEEYRGFAYFHSTTDRMFLDPNKKDYEEWIASLVSLIPLFYGGWYAIKNNEIFFKE